MKNKRPISQMSDEDFGSDQIGSKSHWPKVLMVILVVVIIVAGWIVLSRTGIIGSDKIAEKSKDWQAVFLVNGQVYFGQVKDVSSKTLVLKNIYYLQVVSKPLQGTQATASEQQKQELTLVKLGNEIHGPYDSMIINRDQILLTEKLKKDSTVVKAINDYLAKQKEGQNANNQQQQQQAIVQ